MKYRAGLQLNSATGSGGGDEVARNRGDVLDQSKSKLVSCWGSGGEKAKEVYCVLHWFYYGIVLFID